MDDKTRAWSKRFFEKTKRMPTMWQAGVYSSTMVYLNAIKEAGTDEPLKVAAKMREKPIEDFFARNGRLREDGLMVHDLMLVQVKSPEESKYPWTTTRSSQRFPERKHLDRRTRLVCWGRSSRRKAIGGAPLFPCAATLARGEGGRREARTGEG